MKIKDKKPIILAALKALGVRVRELEITPDTELIGNVFVNGEFFACSITPSGRLWSEVRS